MGLEFALDQKPFDLVCIMAGTNDLGSAVDVGKIEENILNLHNKVHERQINTLAIGIPESDFCKRVGIGEKKRKSVNKRLQNEALECERMHFVENPVKFNRDNFAVDGLHFSKVGYEVLGNFIGANLDMILK